MEISGWVFFSFLLVARWKGIHQPEIRPASMTRYALPYEGHVTTFDLLENAGARNDCSFNAIRHCFRNISPPAVLRRDIQARLFLPHYGFPLEEDVSQWEVLGEQALRDFRLDPRVSANKASVHVPLS